MLFAGPQDVFDRHSAIFGELATATYVGADPGQAYLNALALVGGDPAAFVPFARKQFGHVLDALAETADRCVTAAIRRGPRP